MRSTEAAQNPLLAAITAAEFPRKTKKEWLSLIDGAAQSKKLQSAIETQPAPVIEEADTTELTPVVPQSLIDTQEATEFTADQQSSESRLVKQVPSLDSTPALHRTLAGRRLEQYLLLSPEIDTLISTAIGRVMQGFGERTGLLLSAQNIESTQQFDEFVSAYFEAQGNSGVANRATFIELFFDDVADTLLTELIAAYHINIQALESPTGLYANMYTVGDEELRDIITRLLKKIPQVQGVVQVLE